jgi:hypothetical protein
MKTILIVLFSLQCFFASSQCIVVDSAHFTNPSGDNTTFDLRINWTSVGLKHLKTYVISNADTVFTACFQVSTPSQQSGTSLYTGIIAPSGFAGLSVIFSRWNGPCNAGTKCGPDQFILSGGVLDIKFEKIIARNIDADNSEVIFKVASAFGRNTATINLRMKSGIVKKYPIEIKEEVRSGEWWKIIINHKTGSYKVTKL